MTTEANFNNDDVFAPHRRTLTGIFLAGCAVLAGYAGVESFMQHEYVVVGLDVAFEAGIAVSALRSYLHRGQAEGSQKTSLPQTPHSNL
jgi:hypothetical protein